MTEAAEPLKPKVIIQLVRAILFASTTAETLKPKAILKQRRKPFLLS